VHVLFRHYNSYDFDIHTLVQDTNNDDYNFNDRDEDVSYDLTNIEPTLVPMNNRL
jgi:hypothetical protein